LQNACDTNSSCLGFNTNGILKAKVLPKNEWYRWTSDPTKGFYAKKSLEGSPLPASVSPYDNSKVYRAGDKMTYKGKTYMMNVSIGGAGFTPDHPYAISNRSWAVQ
jgi:hypothetical protein